MKWITQKNEAPYPLEVVDAAMLLFSLKYFKTKFMLVKYTNLLIQIKTKCA